MQCSAHHQRPRDFRRWTRVERDEWVIKPLNTHTPEIAIAIGATAVTLAVKVVEGRRVGLIWRVVIKRGRGAVLN